MLPEVRSTPGAVWVFTFSLYPYVYLLARTALTERASQLMEAARLLGAPLARRIREVALPLARPAVAAGVALALMETLADFGVVSYFGIQTFTAGIYKAWLAMDNRIAAAQLATMLLARGGAAAVAGAPRAAPHALFDPARRARRQRRRPARAAARRGARRWPGWSVRAADAVRFCAAGAVHAAPADRRLGRAALDLVRAVVAQQRVAGAVCRRRWPPCIALALAFAVRVRPGQVTRGVVRLASLGYAVPGAVIVVGLLLPVGWLQAVWPDTGVGYFVTATALGIVWAYLVRFTAVALQSVQSGYARIPASLDDSARMLGTTGLGLAARVHWPLLKRSTAAAALLVFVDVMKELPATLVLRPFNSDTLAVVTYQLARDERLGEAALPALALVLVGLVPVMLLSRTLRQR